ncbi:glycosyl transferase [Serinicoccus sp. CUA-874]|uniref:glycosyltransferase family 2 protein n=1 Tax=Serinicoccus sp. CUA-874 TaxID=1517939 RepID=UPI00096314A3|nr:glycosyltransferase [Serinicoccus sp. CUA-874]OLT16605.1 glycosyl transferase [Serinicoccus sp. CUA-874]
MTRPSVTAVVPAHARPEELRRVIRAIRDQDYDGALDVVVVFDRAEPDLSLVEEGERPVRVLENTRTPGLAGARNTGVLAAEGELVAFCDDDDYWLAHKLDRQVTLVELDPAAVMVSSGIFIDNHGRSTPRTTSTPYATHAMLRRSRLSMLHSSTFVFRRQALIHDIGLVDEGLPGSQSEDWDLLLRASTLHPVLVVVEPLVTVTWGQKSFFRHDWPTKIASNQYLLEKHDDVRKDRVGAARLMGKIAFAQACLGQRGAAWQWAARTVLADPRQWRGPLAAAAAVHPRVGRTVLDTLNKRGRGV